MRKRRQRSYGRQQLRRVQREFLAKYRRVLLAGLGWFAALAAVIVLIPLPYVTGSERGFCLGVVTTTSLAFVGVFFIYSRLALADAQQRYDQVITRFPV